MKSKILLTSVTIVSALILAACGNDKKNATETTVAPTTEVTTTAPTTTAGTAETKEVSLADTQRVGRGDAGYFNVPKDWVEYKDPNGALNSNMLQKIHTI